MTKTTALLLTVLLGVGLGACESDVEPSAPPSSEDSLTGAAPPDDANRTTSPTSPLATESPSDEESTTAAEGPPPMPEAATEDTPEGAEAFVRHYIDLMNYGAVTGTSGHLPPLAADGCEVCVAWEDSFLSLEEVNATASGEMLELLETRLETADPMVVSVDVRQIFPEAVNEDGEVVEESRPPELATFRFSLRFTEEGWKLVGTI